MKALTKSLLAGAVLAALPLSGALACTTGAWSATAGATAGDPSNGVARYSGECALESGASTGSVTDNSPNGEADYRARFYVYTGTASGNPVIFKATETDGAAGAALVQITYDTTANQFDFVSGAATGSASGIQDNKWYSIEFYYDAGNAITASVQGAAAASATNVTFSGAPAAGTVGSAQLGVITAATAADSMKFDEFESTRSTTTAIGRLLRQDANGDASCNANDLSATSAEVVGSILGVPALASGQPDCTEDGTVDANDLSCQATTIVSDILNGTTCGL